MFNKLFLLLFYYFCAFGMQNDDARLVELTKGSFKIPENYLTLSKEQREKVDAEMLNKCSIDYWQIQDQLAKERQIFLAKIKTKLNDTTKETESEKVLALSANVGLEDLDMALKQLCDINEGKKIIKNE